MRTVLRREIAKGDWFFEVRWASCLVWSASRALRLGTFISIHWGKPWWEYTSSPVRPSTTHIVAQRSRTFAHFTIHRQPAIGEKFKSPRTMKRTHADKEPSADNDPLRFDTSRDYEAMTISQFIHSSPSIFNFLFINSHLFIHLSFCLLIYLFIINGDKGLCKRIFSPSTKVYNHQHP